MQIINEATSCNQGYNGKLIRITHCASVFVASGIQQAMRMRRNVIYGMFGCKIFFHIISYTARFPKRKKFGILNVCFDLLYKFCLKHFAL